MPMDRSRDVETKKSFCRFCHAFCGLEVDVDGGRIVAVRGDQDHAASQGYTCLKGRAEMERIYHPDRLLSSKQRVDGELVDVDTEEALDAIASKLGAIIDEHGPHAVAAYVGDGGHRTSAGGPWLVRKWLDGIGSRSMYTSFTIDSPGMLVAAARLFGSPLPLQLFDIEHAEVGMFVGTNPVLSHFMSMPQSNPVRRLRDAKKGGLKLIVVDPRRSDAAKVADIHLQVKPGEDATLFAGMIKVIIDQELYDHEYVERYTSGLETLQKGVTAFDLDYVSRRTDVPADLIREAATTFATARSGAAQTGTGLHMARHQNLSIQLVMTLNALCGRYDRRGGLTRHAGAINFALPEFTEPVSIPEYKGPESRIRGIRGSFNYLGFFEEMPSNTITDEILTPGEGKIRALIVHGGNPALVFPDAASTTAALDDLDLLVVTDHFVNRTAEHADYVVAVKHPFERADIPRLMDPSYPFPFSQYAEALVDAPDGVIEDWEVFWRLAQKMGTGIDLPGLDISQDPTTDDMLDALHSTSRIPIDEIRKYPGGKIFGELDPLVGGIIPNMVSHDGQKIALADPDGMDELDEVLAEPTISGGGYRTEESFAFRMITYRMKEVYCSQGQNLPSLTAKRRFNPVLLNPEAMRAVGVEDGDTVIVENDFGRVEGIAEASHDVAPNVIAFAFGWGGADDDGTSVQPLIDDDSRFDPITGLALQSAVPVNVFASTRPGPEVHV
jgi:anaerobic selenocysteine-containing dehydrogenase